MYLFQTILLIGMSGDKSFLGHYLSHELHRAYYNVSPVLHTPPTTKKEWFQFYRTEHECLRTILSNSEPKIISMSDACIEYAPTFHLLHNHDPSESVIVHVIPSQETKTDPAWQKRAKYYFFLSDIDYWNMHPPTIVEELSNYLNDLSTL